MAGWRRYLSSPVRLGVLVAVVLIVVVALLPPELRQVSLLRAAKFVGWMLPSIAISVAVGWPTLSWSWFKRTALVIVSASVLLFILAPNIEQLVYEMRVDSMLENSLAGVHGEWRIIYDDARARNTLVRGSRECPEEF